MMFLRVYGFHAALACFMDMRLVTLLLHMRVRASSRLPNHNPLCNMPAPSAVTTTCRYLGAVTLRYCQALSGVVACPMVGGIWIWERQACITVFLDEVRDGLGVPACGTDLSALVILVLPFHHVKLYPPCFLRRHRLALCGAAPENEKQSLTLDPAADWRAHLFVSAHKDNAKAKDPAAADRNFAACGPLCQQQHFMPLDLVPVERAVSKRVLWCAYSRGAY